MPIFPDSVLKGKKYLKFRSSLWFSLILSTLRTNKLLLPSRRFVNPISYAREGCFYLHQDCLNNILKYFTLKTLCKSKVLIRHLKAMISSQTVDPTLDFYQAVLPSTQRN